MFVFFLLKLLSSISYNLIFFLHSVILTLYFISFFGSSENVSVSSKPCKRLFSLIKFFFMCSILFIIFNLKIIYFCSSVFMLCSTVARHLCRVFSIVRNLCRVVLETWTKARATVRVRPFPVASFIA